MKSDDSFWSNLNELKHNINLRKYRSEREISDGIVKRILQSLDWPIFEVDIVRSQHEIGGKSVDFVLCDPPSTPKVVVDVEPPGELATYKEQQLINCCAAERIDIAILCNDSNWRFYYPSDQGECDQKSFASIDLSEDDAQHSAWTLKEYLLYNRVRSGEAQKEAKQVWEAERERRDVEAKFNDIWNSLLLDPKSLILDYFVEEVQREMHITPTREQAAAFLARQVIRPEIASPPPDEPSTVYGKRQSSITINGKTQIFKNAKDAFVRVFTWFAERDPNFCATFSRHRGSKIQYVAKQKESLYPHQPDRAKYSAPLAGGWWLATQSSNARKVELIKIGCKVAGVTYGQELIVDFPENKRKG